jgi:ubiquinone/menaquinone biosynthesis C-methylase UbiE
MGSGNGWLQRREQFRKRSVVSVDLGIRNLRKIREDNPDALCVVADAVRLPFRRDSFSVVVASEVLEHLNDPGEALGEAHRIMKDDGKIIVRTPYKEKLKYALCIHCNKATPHNAHIHSFDEKRLKKLMLDRRLCVPRHSKQLSKVFTKSRLSFLLRFLSYRMWRFVDLLFIFIFRDAQTLIITAKPDFLNSK